MCTLWYYIILSVSGVDNHDGIVSAELSVITVPLYNLVSTPSSHQKCFLHVHSQFLMGGGSLGMRIYIGRQVMSPQET